MKIRIKSNYLTRYVLQDYGNKEALLPFFVCLVSVYLFFRSFAFFFLCQFTVWRIFFFAFLLWSQLMENSWIHLSLIHLNSFSLFVVFGIFDFCSTSYQFSEQRKESIVCLYDLGKRLLQIKSICFFLQLLWQITSKMKV